MRYVKIKRKSYYYNWLCYSFKVISRWICYIFNRDVLFIHSNYLLVCSFFERLKLLINKTNCKEVEHSKSTIILINVTCKMMNISSWQIRLFVLRILSFNHLFVFVGCWKILWTESLFLRSIVCLIYFTLFLVLYKSNNC